MPSVQAILGGLFYNQSVGLFDDLPEMSFNDVRMMYDDV